MQIKTKAIVISTVKYQEKSLIVKCYTLSDGLKTYFVRDAYSGKKTNQKAAYFIPLTLLEIEATHKNNALSLFKEIKLAHSYQTIQTCVIKNSVVLFVAEVLHLCIKEEERNEGLFTFLETSLLWLDINNEVYNYHLIVLLEITSFLGFYPDTSTLKNSYFNLEEGVFSNFLDANCLSEQETNLLKNLIDLKFENPQKVFSVHERHTLLKILLQYYGIHLDGFKIPKSLEILKEVFL